MASRGVGPGQPGAVTDLTPAEVFCPDMSKEGHSDFSPVPAVGRNAEVTRLLLERPQNILEQLR